MPVASYVGGYHGVRILAATHDMENRQPDPPRHHSQGNVIKRDDGAETARDMLQFDERLGIHQPYVVYSALRRTYSGVKSQVQKVQRPGPFANLSRRVISRLCFMYADAVAASNGNGAPAL